MNVFIDIRTTLKELTYKSRSATFTSEEKDRLLNILEELRANILSAAPQTKPKLTSSVDKDGNYIFHGVNELLRWVKNFKK